MKKQIKVTLLGTMLFAGAMLYADDTASTTAETKTEVNAGHPDTTNKTLFEKAGSLVRSTVTNPWFYRSALVAGIAAVGYIGYKVYKNMTTEATQK